MKVVMVVLALFGPARDADWREIGRAMVPADHCEAQREQFNRKGTDTRVICLSGVQAFAQSCARGKFSRAEKWEP